MHLNKVHKTYRRQVGWFDSNKELCILTHYLRTHSWLTFSKMTLETKGYDRFLRHSELKDKRRGTKQRDFKSPVPFLQDNVNPRPAVSLSIGKKTPKWIKNRTEKVKKGKKKRKQKRQERITIQGNREGLNAWTTPFSKIIPWVGKHRLVSIRFATSNLPVLPHPRYDFWKGHCSTASNQSGANRMTVFRLHTKSQPRIKQLRKLHLSSLFDRLALGYWNENFADWYETKGKSISFSHAGFESRAMRFSGPKCVCVWREWGIGWG